jgi:hypothetical protein
MRVFAVARVAKSPQFFHRSDRKSIVAVCFWPKHGEAPVLLFQSPALETSITGGESMYIGPDTILPLTSVLAAVAGVAVMFWHRTMTFFRALTQRVSRIFRRVEA